MSSGSGQETQELWSTIKTSSSSTRNSSVLSPTLRKRVDKLLKRSSPGSSATAHSRSYHEELHSSRWSDSGSNLQRSPEATHSSTAYPAAPSEQLNLYSFADSVASRSKISSRRVPPSTSGRDERRHSQLSDNRRYVDASGEDGKDHIDPDIFYGVADSTMRTEEMHGNSSGGQHSMSQRAEGVNNLGNWERRLVHRLEAEVHEEPSNELHASENRQSETVVEAAVDSFSIKDFTGKKLHVRPLSGAKPNRTETRTTKRPESTTPSRWGSPRVVPTKPLASGASSSKENSVKATRSSGESVPPSTTSVIPSEANELKSRATSSLPSMSPSTSSASFPTSRSVKVHFMNNNMRYEHESMKLRRNSIQSISSNTTSLPRKRSKNKSGDTSVSCFRPVLGNRSQTHQDSYCVSDKLTGERIETSPTSHGTRTPSNGKSRSLSPRKDYHRPPHGTSSDENLSSSAALTKKQHSKEKQQVLVRAFSGGRSPTTQSPVESTFPTSHETESGRVEGSSDSFVRVRPNSDVSPSSVPGRHDPSGHRDSNANCDEWGVSSSPSTNIDSVSSSHQTIGNRAPAVTWVSGTGGGEHQYAVSEGSDKSLFPGNNGSNSRAMKSPWALAAPSALSGVTQPSAESQNTPSSAMSPAFSMHQQLKRNGKLSRLKNADWGRRIFRIRSLLKDSRQVLHGITELAQSESVWLADGFKMLFRTIGSKQWRQWHHPRPRLYFRSAESLATLYPDEGRTLPVGFCTRLCCHEIPPEDAAALSPASQNTCTHISSSELQDYIDGAHKELLSLRKENEERKQQMSRLLDELSAIREVLALSQEREQVSGGNNTVIQALHSQMESLEKQLRETEHQYRESLECQKEADARLEQLKNARGADTQHVSHQNTMSRVLSNSITIAAEHPSNQHWEMERLKGQVSSLTAMAESSQGNYQTTLARQKEAEAKIECLQEQLRYGSKRRGSVADLTQVNASALHVSPSRQTQFSDELDNLRWQVSELHRMPGGYGLPLTRQTQGMERIRGGGAKATGDAPSDISRVNSVHISPTKPQQDHGSEILSLKQQVRELQQLLQEGHGESKSRGAQELDAPQRIQALQNQISKARSSPMNADGVGVGTRADSAAPSRSGMHSSVPYTSSPRERMSESSFREGRVAAQYNTFPDRSSAREYPVTSYGAGGRTIPPPLSTSVADVRSVTATPSTPAKQVALDTSGSHHMNGDTVQHSSDASLLTKGSSPERGPTILVSSPSPMSKQERQQRIADIFSRAADVRKHTGRNSERATVLLETYAQQMRSLKNRDNDSSRSRSQADGGSLSRDTLGFSRSQLSSTHRSDTSDEIRASATSRQAQSGVRTGKGQEWKAALLSPSSQ
eukprot:gb/GECG01009177.1/.p1 GENE.gb/GECG01009177.1/~~gb/GECG01009177.1/.p1  ORF type:complete len:1364 (+),score=181.24 gb/GECG01009177.1/:1-4092(+)